MQQDMIKLTVERKRSEAGISTSVESKVKKGPEAARATAAA